jgi:Cdc6-like AAA superfamily ATPase
VDAACKAGKEGIESGKLYTALSRLCGERALRQRVERLEKTGIIETETVQSGSGRSRLIKIKRQN